jgi:putative nucleotidyltransferase with HDIG domain
VGVWASATESVAGASPADPARRDVHASTHARRTASAILGVAMVAVPVGVATAVSLAAGRAVSPPGHGVGVTVWWAVVFAASAVGAWAADWAMRRLFPLVTLLRLALVFPADVESRLGLALRAGSVRDLDRGVIDLRDGVVADPVDAAARVVALAAALQRHDRFTRGHSERVRAYAELLAKELGVPARDRQLLRWGALLHDIGKLEVPSHLLTKPAALDPDEWLEMRRHPAAGARLAEPLRPALGEWVDAVGEHHERYDGTGYPNGLAGDSISLAGRLVAVADSYETMTATRPYKRPMPHDAARSELVAQAGAHFDPAVVRAMLRLSSRRLRWAAGPIALVGDGVAARLIAWVGPRGTTPAVLPWASGTVAAVALATVGVVAGAPNVRPSTAPLSVELVNDLPQTPNNPVTTPTPIRTAGERDVSPTSSSAPGQIVAVPSPPPTAVPSDPVAGEAPRSEPAGNQTVTPPVATDETPPVATPSPAGDSRATPAVPATPAAPALPAVPARGGATSPAIPATPAVPAAPTPPGRGHDEE